MAFEQYNGDIYDLIYAQKDYKKEALFIGEQLYGYNSSARSLLEIGCGSGRHSYHFAEMGFEVMGVDQSQAMLEKAPQNAPNVREFLCTSAQKLALGRTFDVVAAPFHVFSYQNTASDISLFLKSLRTHTQPQAVLYLDFWLADAVLSQKPEKRSLVAENNQLKVVRLATPKHLPLKNIVEVHYNFEIWDKVNQNSFSFSELHSMRYFSLAEVEFMLNTYGFVVRHCGEFLSNMSVSEHTWNVFVVAQRV